MLPLSCIRKVLPRSGGVAKAVDQVYVRHVSGGTSVLGFKSYGQGRTSFEGTGKHVIWVDEDCSLDIYPECLTRLLTTQGITSVTFTPLQGLTELVLRFLPSGRMVERRLDRDDDVDNSVLEHATKQITA